MLSLAGQCHPSLFLLAPLAIIGWMHAYRFSTASRQRLIAHTCLSGLLALALMTPWIIALYKHIHTLEYLRPISTGSPPGWQAVSNTIFSALGGSFGTYAVDAPPLPQFAILTLVASAWLLARGLFRQDGLPGLLVVLGFFVVPTVVVVLGSQQMQELTASLFFARGVELNWWIYTVMGNAALIQGAFIGGVAMLRPTNGHLTWFWKWRGLLHLRYLRSPTILAVIITATILIRAHIQFDYRHDTGVHSLYEGRNTLDDSSAALKYGKELAVRNNQELMLLASDPPLQTMRCIGCRNWEALMLTKENDIRVIWDNYGMPLPSNGAVLLAPFNYSARPLLFYDGKTVFNWFRVARLPSAAHFEPDLPLPQPVHFSSNATVFGFLREIPNSMPSPGKPWIVHMLWRINTPNPEQHKLSVQLVDINGTKYAQVDPPGMIADQQKPGERVLSQLDFQISEDLPASGPLYLRFSMYNDVEQTEIVDATITDPNLLQFRRSAEPLASMANGLELDSFSMQSKFPQGPPLNITTTWKTPPERTNIDSLRINWQLVTDDNVVAFDQTTEFLPQSSIKTLPGNIFIKEQYTLRIPTDIVHGKHRLIIYSSDSTSNSTALFFVDNVEITPRQRRFTPLEMSHTKSAVFGEKIKLEGYDLNYNDSSIDLTLHWKALGQIDNDYKYFVHLWKDDMLVAQIDTMPDSYQYPTSWWAPDEAYSDIVSIGIDDLNAGQYELSAGVYDPSTNSRLTISENVNSDILDNAIILHPVVLE